MDDFYLPIKKIIMGANNSNIKQILRLVKIYTKVGANMFDISANRDLIKKTLKILNKSNSELKPLLCVSIPLENDIHANKAVISGKVCTQCKVCLNNCPQRAIILKNDVVRVVNKQCSGCGNCLKYCTSGAIKMKSYSKSFDEQFALIKNLKIDCIEIHTNGKNENLYKVFEKLNDEFFGILGLCIANNDNLEEKIEIIENVKKIIAPRKLLVQADGAAMSGFNNSDNTTQKALLECESMGNIRDIFIIPSGGVNSRTYNLAKTQNIKIDGVAVGSYARKIVSPYITSRKIKRYKYKKAISEADLLIKSIV